MLPTFTQDFQADFAQILRADEPFAFVRFHDGEYAICQGVPYQAKSGWHVNGQSWLQHPLLQALTEADLPGYYLGISPPCDMSECAHWYRTQVKVPNKSLTFATLFQHANYLKLEQVLRRFPNPLLVSCKGGDISVPANAVRVSWDIDKVVDQLLEVRGRPIFVAAGPCANVIIHRYWSAAKPDQRQTIIDVGSLLDVSIHGSPTRPYHEEGSSLRGHKCDWNDWKPFQPLVGNARERRMRGAQQAEVFQQLQDNGFTGTMGGSATKSPTIHRRGGDGILSPAVRDQEKSNSGVRNVRIRPNKNRR